MKNFIKTWVILWLLFVIASAFGQVSVSGGSYSGVATFTGSSTDWALYSCSPADIAGRTLISACGLYPSGLYYMDGDLDGAGTCIAVNGGTGGFDLQMCGHEIRYGSTMATQVLTTQTATVGTGQVMTLKRPTSAASDGEWATVIEVSDTIACDVDLNGSYETSYAEETNYTLAYNHPHGKYGGGGDNNRGLIWISGKPAANTPCQIPSYTVSFPRFGIINSNSNTYVRNTGNTLSGVPGLKVTNGTISTSANAAPFSFPIFNGAHNSPSITNVIVNAKGWSTPGIGLSYSSLGTLRNITCNQDATSGNVFWRDYYQGYCVWDYNRDGADPVGATYENVKIVNGMQGGMVAYQSSASIVGFTVSGLKGRFTNDFGLIVSGSNSDVNGANIDCYTNPTDSCRGILVEGSGNRVHHGTVKAHEGLGNVEYGGCESGGAYGFQVEHNATSGELDHYNLYAYADTCDANGARFSGEATTYLAHDNYIAAYRIGSSTARAVGVHTRGFNGGELRDDTIEGDSCIIGDISQDSTEPATNAIFRRVTLKKGPNPDATFHTFCPDNYQPSAGDTVLNWNCIDCSVANGASLTDVTALKIGQTSRKGYELLISWTYTVHLTAAGSPVEGATVSLTDALSNVFSGTTNASGDAAIEVPQYRIYNTAALAVNTENRNPYSLSITKAGCSTVSASNITVSGTVTDSRTTTCP